MAEPFQKPHLFIEGFSTNQDYKYPRKQNIQFNAFRRDRQQHGGRILNELRQVLRSFEAIDRTNISPDMLWDDVVYVQFVSPWGYELKFDSLNSNTNDPLYQLISIRKEVDPDEPDVQNNFRYRALVMLKRGGISHFISRVQEYLRSNTIYRGRDTGKPVASDLIANIEEVRLATLEAFWTEGNIIPFPEQDEVVWWEVWFRKQAYDFAKITNQVQLVGSELGQRKLEFAEHVVHLVKASARQLSSSLYLLDSLAELRKPQELNDFITDSSITFAGKQQWAQDLIDRTDASLDPNRVMICLFDSGLTNAHPLLVPLVPETHLHAWQPHWGRYDTWPNGGHGTGMAGLSFYGDLTEALATPGTIRILHGVESFKISHPASSTDKELYGVAYRDGCNTVIVERPNNARIFCLAITNDNDGFYGRPSSSSATIDSLAFGKEHEADSPKLFFVSAGNVFLNQAHEYPDTNFISSIQDPGQAYNALTVGAHTLKDRLVQSTNSVLARYGAMSPFNSTSGAWETRWPNKPDIVLEGGNLEVAGTNLNHNDLLNPLSLDSDFNRYLFMAFGGTSAATAVASKMAAEILSNYPSYWPETIRGLLVHSANWNSAMLNGRNFSQLNEAQRRALIRSVGYGVPNLSKAINSAINSLTLIAQENITPFKLEGSSVKYNEYHLFQLPWPKDVLLHEVGAQDAKVTITLSYFIEPNPGGYYGPKFTTYFRA